MTVPEDCGSSPAMMRISVDLPQPEAPTSVMNSPSATSRSIPERTGTPPKDLPIDLSSTLAMGASVAAHGRSDGVPRWVDFVQHVVDPQRRQPRHVRRFDRNLG